MAKTKKTYSPAEKKRRRRRHNAIVYTIAILLFLTGAVIIISDQTLFFPRLWESFSSCVGISKDVKPTPSPDEQNAGFVWVTADPNDTDTHWDIHIEGSGHEPGENDYWDNPYETLPPGVTPDPNATPRPTRPPTPPTSHAPVAPTSSYAPKNVYFLNRYTAATITDTTCPVDPVGYNSKGQMDTVHSAFRAGWFMYGGDPVHGGNTLIAGHNRYSGRKGWFSLIQEGKIQPGDVVVVELNSGDYTYFMVDFVERYEYDAVPDEIMNTGGRPRLTLITCYGDYDSSIHTSRHRVIAVCYPVYLNDNGGNTTAAPTDPPPVTQNPATGRE
ncbi:MAG: class F sortase [Clostridia bacterium]|nr:class F sortase [Clostridia bacterium]